MREGKSSVPLGKFAITVLVVLLAYCALFWLPPFTDTYMLGISVNVWAGLSLFVVAPVLGLIYTMTTPVAEEEHEVTKGDAS
ncbi:hypothetical protein [Citricoccus sp.]|uniref:hypothetical protein n=1 Tax=Citricoccus sp. TaxID=1978372 RepID=UPI0028BF1584|nr:hypothetical protein [Citricoccus sp.]